MFTHNLEITYVAAGLTLTKKLALSYGLEKNYDEAIPTGGDTALVDGVIDAGQLKAYYLLSDQAVTVKLTHAGGTIEIDLAANVPVVWYPGCGYAMLVTADITAIAVENLSGETANVQLFFQSDPTV